MANTAAGSGTQADPWQLKTPPGKSAYEMWKDESSDPPELVCQVGSTQLRYQWRAVEDLHAMLVAHGDWMPLGGADEQKPAPAGSVEAWGRAEDNPASGWYGLKNGLRGRFESAGQKAGGGQRERHRGSRLHDTFLRCGSDLL